MNRVLLAIEDRRIRRAIFTRLLLDDCAIAEAESVAQVEEALRGWDGAFDLLVLDDNLLDGTGWDVLRRLARHMPALRDATRPRVVVLACQRPAQCRLDEFHPDAVLIKPFPLRALELLAVRLLRGETAEEDLSESGALSAIATPA